MITYHPETDIFSMKADAMCHGVNTKGILGGLAQTVMSFFPEMSELYKSMCTQGSLEGGDMMAVKYEESENKVWIYNLATQREPGANAQLALIQDSMEKMKTHAKENGVSTINCPLIGCGIGGLIWPEVKEILELVFGDDDDITLHVVSLTTFDSESDESA